MIFEKKSCINSERKTDYKQNLKFSILGQNQAGSGSGSVILKTESGSVAKSSGSAKLILTDNVNVCSPELFPKHFQ